jgi:hypothetical protein
MNFSKTMLVLMWCFHRRCDGASLRHNNEHNSQDNHTQLVEPVQAAFGTTTVDEDNCFGSDCPLRVSFMLQLAGYSRFGTPYFSNDQQAAVRFAVSKFAAVPSSPTDTSTRGRAFHAVTLRNIVDCSEVYNDDDLAVSCVPGAASRMIKFDVQIATANETTGDLLVQKLNPVLKNQTAFLGELRAVLQSGDTALWPEFSSSTVPPKFNVIMLSRPLVTSTTVPTPSPTRFPTENSWPTPNPTYFPPFPNPSPWQPDDDEHENDDDDAETAGDYVLQYGLVTFLSFIVCAVVFSCEVWRRQVKQLRRQLVAASKGSAALSSAQVPQGRPVSAGTAAAFVLSCDNASEENNKDVANPAAPALVHGDTDVETTNTLTVALL